MNTLKLIPSIGSIILSGAVIWQIAVYFLSKSQQIVKVADFPLQSAFLLIVLLVYVVYALYILVNKNSKNTVLFSLGLILIALSGIIKILFHVKAYGEKPPFELIYFANEVSTFVLLMCVLHITSLLISGEKK